MASILPLTFSSVDFTSGIGFSVSFLLTVSFSYSHFCHSIHSLCTIISISRRQVGLYSLENYLFFSYSSIHNKSIRFF